MNLTTATFHRWSETIRGKLSLPQREKLADTVSLGILLFWMILGRWDSVLYPIPLSADEVQAGANALRILQYGYSWNAVDGHTAGPFNSLLLAWPALLGKDVTLNSIRLTAFLLVFGILSLTYFSIKRIGNAFIALCLTLPLAVFYSYTRHPDFLHYSSELLPIFLLLVTFYISLNVIGASKPKHLGLGDILISGLALGITPFAKLQALPIAATIAIVLAWIIALHNNRSRNVSLFLIAGAAPFLALMIPLVYTGTLQDFYISYLKYARLYVKQALYLVDIQRLIESHLLLRHTFYFYMEVIVIGSAMYLIRERSHRTDLIPALVYTATLATAALFAIATPGWEFPHYLTFFLPFLVILSAILLLLNCENRHVKRFQQGYGILVCLHIVLIGLMPEYDKDYYFRYLNRYNAPLKTGFSLSSPRTYDWIPGDNHNLLIWGWMPQWYLLAGDSPATRESHTERQSKPTPLLDYYHKRLIFDLSTSKPTMIIDAVAGKSFGFHDNTHYGPHLAPILEEKLQRDYITLGHSNTPNHDCPRMYLEKDRYAKYVESTVRIREIAGPSKPPSAEDISTPEERLNDEPFSSRNMNDNSITEDTCIDYWLAPNGTLPSLFLTFESPDRVNSYKLLNTRNSKKLDRETKTIKLDLLYRGAIVDSKIIDMKRYPFWTTINIEKSVLADAARIQVLTFNGPGAGLNEIKFYKEPVK